MARQCRYDLSEVAQHVIQRGNNRCVIFVCEDDCAYFKDLLVESGERYAVDFHAYVLMTNHAHFLITPHEVGAVGRLLQSLGRRYVQYFNRRYGRSGTLWEGRYRATVVDSDGYLMACYRYIELNPVRAGLVRRPEDFVWSSFRRNASGAADALVTTHPIFDGLGPDANGRQTAYRKLFNHDLDSDMLNAVREATNKGWVLGGSDFTRKIDELVSRQVNPTSRGGDRKSAEFRQTRVSQINRV